MKLKMLINITKSNRKLFFSTGAITAAAVLISMYYLLMPAWIIVIREGEDENVLPSIENRFEITPRDLAEFPELRKPMVEADANYPYVNWMPPTKALYWEGTKIVERFDMDSQYPPEYEAVLIYNDNDMKKVYHVQVVFGYEQHGQM